MATTNPYQFRQEVKDNSPSWLQTGLNEKLMYTVGLILDALGDALVQGVQSRFPGLVDFQALGLVGQERRIKRSPLEDDAAYAMRLRGWLDYHRTRGNPYALLRQMSIRYGNAFIIELIYRNGRRFTLGLDGSITRDSIVWSPDSHPERWARYWMLVHSDDFSTPEAQADLLVIPRDWAAAHCNGTVIVMPTGSTLIDYHPPHLIDEPDTIDTPVATIKLAV